MVSPSLLAILANIVCYIPVTVGKFLLHIPEMIKNKADHLRPAFFSEISTVFPMIQHMNEATLSRWRHRCVIVSLSNFRLDLVLLTATRGALLHLRAGFKQNLSTRSIYCCNTCIAER